MNKSALISKLSLRLSVSKCLQIRYKALKQTTLSSRVPYTEQICGEWSKSSLLVNYMCTQHSVVHTFAAWPWGKLLGLIESTKTPNWSADWNLHSSVSARIVSAFSGSGNQYLGCKIPAQNSQNLLQICMDILCRPYVCCLGRLTSVKCSWSNFLLD